MEMTFTIPEEETVKYMKWLAKHEKVCKQKDVGAIGGKYTYSFTQTGLGCIHKLKCACGGEACFTDFENW